MLVSYAGQINERARLRLLREGNHPEGIWILCADGHVEQVLSSGCDQEFRSRIQEIVGTRPPVAVIHVVACSSIIVTPENPAQVDADMPNGIARQVELLMTRIQYSDGVSRAWLSQILRDSHGRLCLADALEPTPAQLARLGSYVNGSWRRP